LDNVRAVIWYDPPETWWVTSLVAEVSLALLRSEDDGATWATVAAGNRASSYAVSRVDPSVVYRSAGRIERSDDGGATWRELWPADPELQEGWQSRAFVSPTHRDRIAYDSVSARRTTTLTDLAGGDADWIEGGASLWAHPETGTVYWNSGTRVGVVDFANVQFARSGGSYEQYGGVGFASDDPESALWTKYDVYRQSSDVFVVGGEGEPLLTLSGAQTLIEYPESVAVHRPSDTTLLTGWTRVPGAADEEAVIASTDGGGHWSQVGSLRGQLFFLSGRGAVFLQTEDDLFMMPLPPSTGVSRADRTAATWGAIKAGESAFP